MEWKFLVLFIFVFVSTCSILCVTIYIVLFSSVKFCAWQSNWALSDLITVLKSIMGNGCDLIKRNKDLYENWSKKSKHEPYPSENWQTSPNRQQNKSRDRNCSFEFFSTAFYPYILCTSIARKSQEFCEKRNTFGKTQFTQNMASVSKLNFRFFAFSIDVLSLLQTFIYFTILPWVNMTWRF